MAGLTLILSIFDRNFALSLGLESAKDPTPQEVTVIESQGSISQPVGFSRNEEGEEDEDARRTSHHRPVPGGVRIRSV
jgi:hypothetical protein